MERNGGMEEEAESPTVLKASTLVLKELNVAWAHDKRDDYKQTNRLGKPSTSCPSHQARGRFLY